MLVVGIPNTIFEDGSIAETQFVIFLNQFFLISSPAFVGKLFSFENVRKFTSLVCLSECPFGQQSAFNFIARQLIITFDDDVSHLHFFFFIDDNIQYNLIFIAHIVSLSHFDVGIFKTFIVEISFSQYFCAVNHVRRNLGPFKQTQFIFHIFAFRLFQSYVVNHRHSGSKSQVHVQENLITNDRIGRDFHVREQSMSPITLHGVGNIVSRNGYFLPHTKSRYAS